MEKGTFPRWRFITNTRNVNGVSRITNNTGKAPKQYREGPNSRVRLTKKAPRTVNVVSRITNNTGKALTTTSGRAFQPNG